MMSCNVLLKIVYPLDWVTQTIPSREKNKIRWGGKEQKWKREGKARKGREVEERKKKRRERMEEEGGEGSKGERWREGKREKKQVEKKREGTRRNVLLVMLNAG